MLLPRRLFLATVLLASLATSAFAQTPAAFHKVLFLGNSITKHGPKADIDWAGNWGMAATAEDKDYVHLVTQGLTARAGGKAPEILVKNIADFERAHTGYDISGKLKDAIDFPADLIIICIGENVPGLKTPEEKTQFQTDVTQLLTAVKGNRSPKIVVRSSFWANAPKDEALQAACTAAGGTFVNISALSKDESLYARSERPFKNAGVANHPGDKGMAAIAGAILEAVGN